MKKRSLLLLITTALATVYTIYLFVYFGGAVSGSEGTEQVGAAIASALVTPHAILMGLGAVFGWLGYGLKASWGALVAAILYAVGMVLFIAYIMFALPIMVLAFISYANQKKLNKANAQTAA